MTVNVSGTKGPFVITSQNTDNLAGFRASNTINWSVNNTNTLPGSANVNIRLSVDGDFSHAIGK
jgi:hypothetical protein